jgi:hypothetical protein
VVEPKFGDDFFQRHPARARRDGPWPNQTRRSA